MIARFPWLCLALLVLPVSAAAETKPINFTQTPIQLDGALSQFDPGSKLFDLGGQSSDNSATFYGLWDASYLYLAVEVADTALFCNALPGDSQVAWSNDSIELNVDTLNKKVLAPADPDFRQWILPIHFNDNAFDAYGTGSTGDTSFDGHLEVSFTLQGTLNDQTPDTGYRAILRIPWSDLGLSPKNGLVLGFDGAINDRDGVTDSPTYMDWANLEQFDQVGQWNELRLGGQPQSPDAAVGPTDAAVAPSDGAAAMDAGADAAPPDDGCNCSAAGAPGSAVSGALALLLLALWRSRRSTTRN